ncbi:MAG: signal peptide peptidase SppA [Chitinophagales bacterium]|nr:signal peptide peptidase SppA [Chitinophagales bacterium]
MKQFFKMFFASLLAMIVTGVIIFGVFIGLIVAAVKEGSKSETQTTVADNSVLTIDLSKTMHERSERNSLAVFSDGDENSAGVYDAIKALQEAKEDSKIKGILIKLNPSRNGWATMQQLRNAIVDFRKSGKFVYAYGENITQGAYYMATAADSIYLNPMGDMELKGFATILAFFKGTLDKLELEPEIFYAGKFKSATEPFRADKMSDANRVQVAEFQKDFWSEFLNAASTFSKQDTATLYQLAASGAIEFPQDALKNKLVSNLLYWDQVEDRIKAKTGGKEKDKVKYVSLSEYAATINEGSAGDSRVAVLYAEGSIVDGESDDDYQIASQNMIEQIRKLRNNDKVKAVVLRVNSGGGSALASEVILRELQLLKAKKPLVASMGDVAASGGYYILCQADSIFALPNTITGSIGVFTMMFNSEKLMRNKLGVTFDGVKNAPYADFPNGTRALTADESAKVQRSVDNIYMIFKSRVATGRKMDIALVDSFAQGRVWSGTDALGIKLVDGLGDLDRAIASAASLAKLKDYDVVTYPEPVDKFESLMRRFKGNNASVAEQMVKAEFGKEYDWYKQLKELRRMNGAAMAMMPYSMETK